jgi:hypothetical protein
MPGGSRCRAARESEGEVGRTPHLHSRAYHGISLTSAERTLTALDEASAAGLGDHDSAHMPAYWAKRANS